MNSSNENLQDEYYEEEGDFDAEIDDTSSITSKPAKMSKSEVWNYFTKDDNYKENKKAKCNHCGITYTCTDGSTSNLNKHIKSRHSGKQELSIRDMFDSKKVRDF